MSKPEEKAVHDQMVALVEDMLTLHNSLGVAKTAHDRDFIQRRIEATDGRIDQLAYELYALTESEIEIVAAETELG